MLLQELVDLLDIDAGAGGDAFFARGFQNVGVAALLRGHRQDDRALTLEDAVVDIGGRHLLLQLTDAR